MMYAPYCETQVLATHTGLKQQPTLSTLAILSHLIDILGKSPQNPSLVNDKLLLTFVFLELSAGPRYLVLMEGPSLTHEAASATFLGMCQVVETIRFKTLNLDMSLSHMILFSKKANRVI